MVSWGAGQYTGPVVPRAGTWIEIDVCRCNSSKSLKSYPVRVRGLKFRGGMPGDFRSEVVPRAGTWIEIQKPVSGSRIHTVVPRAGTWIEILPNLRIGAHESPVVPRAGTWIEINQSHISEAHLNRRTPCGYVD